MVIGRFVVDWALLSRLHNHGFWVAWIKCMVVVLWLWFRGGADGRSPRVHILLHGTAFMEHN